MKKIISSILTIIMLFGAVATMSVTAAETDYEVPIAKVGDKTLTATTAHGSWEITDEAATTKEAQSLMVFTNDKMEAGKLTATIDRGREGAQHNTDGIIFCLDEGSNSFWQDGGPTYYFLYIHKDNNKIGLVRTGSGNGNLGFSEKGSYAIPEDQRDNNYTISAEWDASGKITCYFEGEKVIEWTDGNPLAGTRYGLRASGVGMAFTSVVAEHGTPSPDRIMPGNANAIPGTVTVDGVIDEAWAKAPVYTMENVVEIDSTQKDEAGNLNGHGSSTVQFRMMYDGTKVYMLAEITDDSWISGYNTDDWKNDSLMIFVSENGVTRSMNNDKSYVLCAFLENYSAENSKKTGVITRKGTNNTEKEHAVVIDGNKAVLELSFRFNTTTPQEGGFFVMDLQYNDQDSAPVNYNTRTIVWSWAASDPKGPNQIQIGRKGWGYVNFVAEPECEHKGGEATCTDQAVCTECGETYGDLNVDNHGETELKNVKEATETEEGYTGDTVCKDCGKTVRKGETIPVKAPATEEDPKTNEDPQTEETDPVDPPETGDSTVAIAILALSAVAGAAVAIRSRKSAE